MSKVVAKPDPAQFALASFADLLSTRGVIVGEEPGSFDSFHEGMMRSLMPATPYECVISENLIAIEWELLQHQRMRNANLRQITHEAISGAVVAHRQDAYDTAGGAEFETARVALFNKEAAKAEGEDLAKRAVSSDRNIQVVAYAEITSLGMDPLQVMSEAYRTSDLRVAHHHLEIQQLERRRRDVKREFDALQKVRPLDAQAIDASVIERPIDEVTPDKPRKKVNFI
jgi:hypothetical protein